MRRRGESTELAALRVRWRRWTAIVESFARRRRGYRRVDPQAYRALHGEVTASCRSLAAAADGPGRAFYRSLEDLAQPWLTPSTLARADRELLLDLLIRCRRAERELRGRPRAPVARRWAAPVLLAPAVGAVALLSARGGDGMWSRALDDVHSWSVVIRFALGRSSNTERLSLLGVITVLMYMYITSRAARS